MTPKSKSFLAVSSLYRLLSEFDGKTLAAASATEGISENLRMALACLAREANRPGRIASDNDPESVDSLPPDLPVKSAERRVRRILIDANVFRNREQLEGFLKAARIRYRPDPALPRARYVQDLARQIATEPDFRAKFDDAWQKWKSDHQTEGWLDLIRRQ
jgi:hypothetical protein